MTSAGSSNLIEPGSRILASALNGVYYDGDFASFIRLDPRSEQGSPSIADFGLMAPLNAHLGRDHAFTSELKLVAQAYHQWLPGKSACAIVAHDGQKTNHQMLALLTLGGNWYDREFRVSANILLAETKRDLVDERNLHAPGLRL